MFIKNAVSVVVAQILALVFMLGCDVILTRSLGPVGKGQISLINTSIAFIGLISSLGIVGASIFYISHEPESRKEFISTGLTLQLLMACAVSVVIILLIPILTRTILQEEIPAQVLYLSISLIPLTTLLAGLGAVFLGMNEINKYNFLRVIASGMQLALFIFLLILTRVSLVSAVVAMGVSLASANLVGGDWLRRAKLVTGLSLSRDKAIDLLSYGLRGWIGMLFQFLNYRLDVYIVNFFLGVAGVGYYAVAVSLAEMAWYIPNAISLVLFPKTASDWDAAKDFTPLVCRHTTFITILSSLTIAVVSLPMILLLYGNQFRPAVIPLIGLIPGVIFLGIAKVLSSDLNGRKLPQYGTWSATLSLILTIVFDFLLVPSLGILGAAIASTLSYGFAFLLLLYFYTRISKNPIGSVLIIRSNDLRMYVDLWQKSINSLHSKCI